MNLLAGALVVLSAAIHAFWNYSSKSRGASLAYFAVAVAASGACLSPVLYYYRGWIPRLPLEFWLLGIATGLCQAVYFFGLTRAYASGDLSVAYPLLRAIPVVLVALVSLVLNDGSQPAGVGLVGIFVVALGCLCLPLSSFRAIRLASYLTVSCFFAVIAALGTTGYSLVDARALNLLLGVNNTDWSRIGNALFYLEIQAGSTLLFMAVYFIFNREERARLPETLRSQAGMALQTGLLVTLTYGLVLVAMSLTTSVSYIVAFRQLSIPVGGVFGMVIQKEPHPLPRVVGIGLIFAGLVLVALA